MWHGIHVTERMVSWKQLATRTWKNSWIGVDGMKKGTACGGRKSSRLDRQNGASRAVLEFFVKALGRGAISGRRAYIWQYSDVVTPLVIHQSLPSMFCLPAMFSCTSAIFPDAPHMWCRVYTFPQWYPPPPPHTLLEANRTGAPKCGPNPGP